jgi:hypothetical protein
VAEPKFSILYAKLCEILQYKRVISERTKEPVTLLDLLTTSCQQELDDLGENKEERRLLGVVRFACELHKLKLLQTPKLVHACIERLLESASEECLRLTCQVLSVFGKELEEEETILKQAQVLVTTFCI